jgi:MoxR-like ATPase
MRLNIPQICPSDFATTIDALRATKKPAMLHGSPGVGKSFVIKEYCEANNIELCVRMLGQMQAGDLTIPWIDKETGTVRWAIAEFLRSLPCDRPSILFLDELSAATPDVHVMAYQLLLDRRLGEFTLPDLCWVCAAGNRPEDNALAYEMNSALSDRLIHFSITVDSKPWLEWAVKHDIHPLVLGVIQTYPELLTGKGIVNSDDNVIKPTPRSWHGVSDVLRVSKSDLQLKLILPGIVGEAAAAKFLVAMKSASELYPVEEYFNKKETDLLKIAPRTLTSLYSLAYSFAAYCSKAEDVVKALNIYQVFTKVEDDLPRKEVMVSAFSLLLSKAIDNSWLGAVIRDKVYLKEVAPIIRSMPKLNELLAA